MSTRTSKSKSDLKLEKFMADNEDDETDFGAWRLSTLETHITWLRGQVLRMEANWDVMRDDQMSVTVFNKISLMVEESMTKADLALDRGERLMCQRIERARQAAEDKIGRCATGNQGYA